MSMVTGNSKERAFTSLLYGVLWIDGFVNISGWLSLFSFYVACFKNFVFLLLFKDCEIKEEGTKHFLILYNVRMDQAGPVDFQAANAKSSAQLRVKGETDKTQTHTTTSYHACGIVLTSL